MTRLWCYKMGELVSELDEITRRRWQNHDIRWMKALDRQGNLIENMLRFAELIEDQDYRVLKITDCASGYRITTVWIGADGSLESLLGGRPPIFETAKFKRDILEAQVEKLDKDPEHTLDPGEFKVLQRYTSEASARRGHNFWVKQEEGPA